VSSSDVTEGLSATLRPNCAHLGSQLATKQALSKSAVDLMLEHGLGGVSGDAIAEAAGLAPRTFRNYFSNKEEALLFFAEDMQNRFVETVLQRAADEPVLDSLQAAAIALIDSADDLAHLVAGLRIMTHNPALVAHRAESRSSASAALLQCVAERSATDPDADLYPRLVTRCTETLVQSVVEIYASGHASRSDLVGIVEQGFDLLRGGLAAPRS
jgi:AcrR family transcriptional regulator